jgi:4-amino-4-deoxy-L-arabinose transferase-like glycosyltransferase
VWTQPKSTEPDLELQLNLFACCWLIVPIVFFSLSQSKLPGYILPAIPAGAILLAEYLRRHLVAREDEPQPVSRVLMLLHALAAAAPIVPSLLIAYLITQHRLPAGRPMLIALAIAFVLTAAIAMTLASRLRLRMLRFVTLIPVVLSVAAVLKLGTISLDQTLSARPLALELASVETHTLPVAVCGTRRELEYGLSFYRNQTIARYESGSIPAEEHLLVAPPTWKENVAKQTAGRRVSLLGHYAPQNVDYYWVAAAGAKP